MTYRKSAVPYLLLLFVLIIGVPVVNHQVEKKQTIKIKIDSEQNTKQALPIALK